MDKLYIGSHVSMNGPEYYLGSVKEALSYDATTFMFYTGAPQNFYRKPLEELMIDEGLALLKEKGFDLSKLVVHAPYIINPASFAKKDMSVEILAKEVQRTYAFGAKILVLHPGAHVGEGYEQGIINCAEVLDAVLSNDNTDVKIAIETMAGKGSEIGITFEQVRDIIKLCHYPERLGVCLDTCHINDAGYNVHDVDAILEEFDRVIGLDKLLVVHLNDSKNPIGGHKDRHENIGYGEIGFETLNQYVHHPKLKEIPIILETPYYLEKAPYKEEIAMLRDGHFIPNWRDNF